MTTEQIIKRSLSRLKAGDVVIRNNGEQCRILDVFPCMTVKGGPTICYRFFGFDVYRPCMRKMFDLTDDMVNQEGYIPNMSESYALIHGQAAAEKV